MGKISKKWGACAVLAVLVCSSTTRAQDIQDDSDGPEVWGPLWEPAWEGGWFTQASPFALDLSLGRRTFDEGVTGMSESVGNQAELYAVARVSLPWEAFLPQTKVEAPLPDVPLLNERMQSSERTQSLKRAPTRSEESFTPGTNDGSGRETVQPEVRPSQLPNQTTTKRPTEPNKSQQILPAQRAVARHSEVDGRGALLVLVRTMVERVKLSPGSRIASARLSSLIHRSRISGLVPELRLRGVYGFDQTTSLEDAAGLYPGETTTRGGHDSLLEARLTFRLDRLILGDSESVLERQRTSLDEEERKRVGQALAHLLKWKVAVTKALDIRLLPEERAEAIIEEETALTHLHLLTGGWFNGRSTLKALHLDEVLFPQVEEPTDMLDASTVNDAADKSHDEGDVRDQGLFLERK